MDSLTGMDVSVVPTSIVIVILNYYIKVEGVHTFAIENIIIQFSIQFFLSGQIDFLQMIRSFFGFVLHFVHLTDKWNPHKTSF